MRGFLRPAVLSIVFLAFVAEAVGAQQYGPFEIGVRGREPSRLRWEDVGSAYEHFKEDFAGDFAAQYDEFRWRTHDFFHGKIEEYFELLDDAVRESLIDEFPFMFDDEGTFVQNKAFTFEDVFRLGETPPDLLFPLNLPDFRTGALPMIGIGVLKGLVLRGKNGEEKGVIQNVRLRSDPLLGTVVFEVLTPEGETKEESGFAGDALTVRWSDIADRSLTSSFGEIR